MADREQEQKTEQPTPHRRQEALRRGQRPRSRDLAAAAGLLGAFLCLRWLGPGFFDSARSILGAGVAEALGGSTRFTIDGIAGVASGAIGAALGMALPVMAGTLLITTAACVAQGTSGFRLEALGPDFSRIDPFDGARKLFNFWSGVRGLLAAVKLLLVGWLLARALLLAAPVFLGEPGGSAAELWATCWQGAVGLGTRISLVLVAVGACEYGLQRWTHERELRMSRQEILEEIASLEGNTDMKRRRRRAAKDMKGKTSGSEEKGA